MSVKEIAPGAYRVSAGQVNVGVIVDETVTIVDTGYPGKADRITAAISRLGRSPLDVADILVTHYHLDHVGGLRHLSEATGARVHAPAAEAELIRSGGTTPELHPRGLAGAAFNLFAPARVIESNRVDNEIAGDEELSIAGGIDAIHTPGHTPGHLAFLWKRHGGVLFCGDAAANFLRLTPMPANEDHNSADKSFAALAKLDFEVAHLGHGSAITGGASQNFRSAASRL